MAEDQRQEKPHNDGWVFQYQLRRCVQVGRCYLPGCCCTNSPQERCNQLYSVYILHNFLNVFINRNTWWWPYKAETRSTVWKWIIVNDEVSLAILLPSVIYNFTAGYVDKRLFPGSSEKFREEQTKTVTKFSPFGVCRRGWKSTWTLAGRSWGVYGSDNKDYHLAARDAARCVRNLQTFFLGVKFLSPYTTSHLRIWQSTSVFTIFIFALFLSLSDSETGYDSMLKDATHYRYITRRIQS